MTVLLNENQALDRAHRVYRDFTANAELMDMAEAREKWLKDVNTKLRTAEQRGKDEGMQQGMQKKARENARKMRDEGFEVATISRITGLSEQEIRKLSE